MLLQHLRLGGQPGQPESGTGWGCSTSLGGKGKKGVLAGGPVERSSAHLCAHGGPSVGFSMSRVWAVPRRPGCSFSRSPLHEKGAQQVGRPGAVSPVASEDLEPVYTWPPMPPPIKGAHPAPKGKKLSLTAPRLAPSLEGGLHPPHLPPTLKLWIPLAMSMTLLKPFRSHQLSWSLSPPSHPQPHTRCPSPNL